MGEGTRHTFGESRYQPVDQRRRRVRKPVTRHPMPASRSSPSATPPPKLTSTSEVSSGTGVLTGSDHLGPRSAPDPDLWASSSMQPADESMEKESM
jgi:hypothetical protein